MCTQVKMYHITHFKFVALGMSTLTYFNTQESTGVFSTCFLLILSTSCQGRFRIEEAEVPRGEGTCSCPKQTATSGHDSCTPEYKAGLCSV